MKRNSRKSRPNTQSKLVRAAKRRAVYLQHLASGANLPWPNDLDKEAQHAYTEGRLEIGQTV